MARARNIKPGFFTNEELIECQPLTRLLFAGLWTLADREGRLEDRPRRIKIMLLPYDEVDCDELLAELERHGFIQRYAVDDIKLIQVVNFTKHQQPHYKEVASLLPPPPGHTDSGIVSFGVSESNRQRIFDRDGRACVECGSTDRLSLDHIIARSRGGTDDDDNLRTLCTRCNSAKNNREARSNIGSMSDQGQSNVGAIKSLDDPLKPLTVNPHPDSGFPSPPVGSPGADAPPSPQGVEPEEPPKRKRRIGDDFVPSAELMTFAREKCGLDDATIEWETEKFIDHFRGKGESRLDWAASWRKWMRGAAEGRFGRASPGQSARASPPPPRATSSPAYPWPQDRELTDDERAAAADRWLGRTGSTP